MTLLFHPGFHKTGTTWLQDQLFSDRRLFNTLLSHLEVDETVVRPHDLLFDPGPAAALIGDRRGAVPGAIDVVSSEIMVGNPFFGSRDGATIAQRVARIAPDARILLTVRAQPAMMRSLYQQYLKRGGGLAPAEFFVPGCEPGYFGFDPAVFRFDLYAQRYAELFGRDKVIVLPQELLARDPRGFVDSLLRFCGHDPLPRDLVLSQQRGIGRSPPPGATPLFRLANRWRRSPIYPAAPRWSTRLAELAARAAFRQNLFSARYARELCDAIAPFAGYYRESNRALQAFAPVDLGELGYDRAD